VAYHAGATFNNGLQSPCILHRFQPQFLCFRRSLRFVQPSPLRICPFLRSCKLLSVLSSALASRCVGTVTNSRDPSLHDHYNRFPATTIPAVTLSTSADFPVSPVIRLPCSVDFATGRGGLLQFLGMSLSSCCRFNPASVNRRISQCATIHAVFALRERARPLRLAISRPNPRLLSLRPDDSQPPQGWLG
jgi:hypothetical protein